MSGLIVERAGPALTLQDLGRPGFLAQGLSRGGAADVHALVEGAVLLGQPTDRAALEMAGAGGSFVAGVDMRIALTGAPMPTAIDGRPALWNAGHRLRAGQRLTIGAAQAGVYSYLHVGGGFDGPVFLGSRSAHLAAGIGQPVRAGDRLAAGPDPDPDRPDLALPQVDRFAGGTLRLLPGVHTVHFAPETLERFAKTAFTKTSRANRQGAELAFDGPPFATGSAQLSTLSEPMVPGDVQMTGLGMPFVLLPECQTTGGYPRIGTLLPDDLPMGAQAAPGTALRFTFITRAAAMAVHVPIASYAEGLRARLGPHTRDPAAIADLLSHQLIGGVITGWDED